MVHSILARKCRKKSMGDINQLQVELDTCKAREKALEDAIAREKDALAYHQKLVSDFDKLSKIETEQEKALAEAKLKSLEKVANDKLAKKRLNAHEARQIADTTTVPFVHVYKYIRDCAQEGLNKIEWSTYNWSEQCRQRLINELELDGYTVEVNKSCADELTISW